MTASMLEPKSALDPTAHSPSIGEDSQQIVHARIHHVNARPGQIRAESPRHNIHPSTPWCPYNPHPLVHSAHRQGRLITLLTARQTHLALLVCLRLARNSDVPPIDGLGVPLALQDVAVGEDHAAEDAEDDEEDAGPCVAAGGGGCPGFGEEGRGVVVGEGHHHAARHHAAAVATAGAAAHIHA